MLSQESGACCQESELESIKAVLTVMQHEARTSQTVWSHQAEHLLDVMVRVQNRLQALIDLLGLQGEPDQSRCRSSSNPEDSVDHAALSNQARSSASHPLSMLDHSFTHQSLPNTLPTFEDSPDQAARRAAAATCSDNPSIFSNRSSASIANVEKTETEETFKFKAPRNVPGGERSSDDSDDSLPQPFTSHVREVRTTSEKVVRQSFISDSHEDGFHQIAPLPSSSLHVAPEAAKALPGTVTPEQHSQHVSRTSWRASGTHFIDTIVTDMVLEAHGFGAQTSTTAPHCGKKKLRS